MSAKSKTGIAGAGGHGRTVVEAVLLDNPNSRLVFVDDNPSFVGAVILGYPVIGPIEAAATHGLDELVLAIGDNATRRSCATRANRIGLRLRSVTHRRAIISSFSTLAAGTVVLAGSVVNPGAKIGMGAIINTGAIVEHDCEVGEFVHVAPGSCLGGGVIVGEAALIGLGSRILPGIRVGARALIGAGAVVTKDVADDAVVAGVPARRLR